jgi:hypothetical protein
MMKLKSKLGEVVARLVEELRPSNWAEIAKLRTEVRDRNLIDRDDPEVVAALLDFAESACIRRAMQRKDDEGFPLFPSIQVPKEDGEGSKRLYMSERKMKPIHYKQFGGQCHDRAIYWMRMEHSCYGRCNTRYGTQMQIVWPNGWTPDAPN